MLLGRAIPYCTLSLPRGLLIDICDSWVHKIPKSIIAVEGGRCAGVQLSLRAPQNFRIEQRVRLRTLAPSVVAKATSTLYARVRIFAERFYLKGKTFVL